MDIEKPLKIVDGIAKMVKDETWKRKAAELRELVQEEWPTLTEAEQGERYFYLCREFVILSAKCLAKISGKEAN